jgi:hypothetical protein
MNVDAAEVILVACQAVGSDKIRVEEKCCPKYDINYMVHKARRHQDQ